MSNSADNSVLGSRGGLAALDPLAAVGLVAPGTAFLFLCLCGAPADVGDAAEVSSALRFRGPERLVGTLGVGLDARLPVPLRGLVARLPD